MITENAATLNSIGRTLGRLSIFLDNIARNVNYLSDNITQTECFPTVKSIQAIIEEHLHDLKGACFQLGNIDSELQKIGNNDKNQ